MNKDEKKRLRQEIITNVYNTESGKDFLLLLMNYCHYWTPTAALIKSGFDPREIVALNDVVKNCIFANLTAEQIGGLIKRFNKKETEQ